MQAKKSYRDALPLQAKERYERKLKLVGLQECPYSLAPEMWEDDVTKWPGVEFPDIVLYLIGTPGEYTREKRKAYKSLEAYNYFTSGWVGTCFIHDIDRVFSVLKALVRPSQRLSNPPHHPWVAVKRKDGSICTAHCTCMAG